MAGNIGNETIKPVVTKEALEGSRGRYVARIEGIDASGELIFKQRGTGVISADHTLVPDALAGKGVAKALLDALLADARRSGFRIIPYCAFVRAQYARHPEWSALFTVPPGVDPLAREH